MDDFDSAILKAIGRGAQVRILLAARDGAFARLRDAGMGGILDINTNLDATLARLRRMKEHAENTQAGYSQRIVVKFYDTVVPGPMIIVDDKDLFVGTFLQNSGGSPDSPAFWLKRP